MGFLLGVRRGVRQGVWLGISLRIVRFTLLCAASRRPCARQDKAAR